MPQENQRASELNHSEKVGSMAFPAAADSAVVPQPGKPAARLADAGGRAQWPSILSSLSPAAIGHNQFDAVLLAQPFIQRPGQIRSLRKASGRTSLVHTRAQCGKISVQEREGVDTISGRSRSRSHRPWLPEALTSRRSRAGLRNKEFLPRSKP